MTNAEQARKGMRQVRPCSRLGEHLPHCWGTISWCEGEPPRDAHGYWAEVCTCGMGEQERTGHYPEHEDWCDVPSPMDPEDGK